MLISPAQFIDDKGAEAVAKATGRTEGAVRVWKARNVFPREAWPEISLAYPELTTQALLKIEKRFPRRKSAKAEAEANAAA